MNNAEDLTTPQGAREKRIYKIDTFVNQDGFKIEEHHLVDDTSAPPQFYGFYLVNTEIGPIDRYFKFKDQLSVDECFEAFRTMAEADAEKLAKDMKAEAQRLESLEAGAPQGPEVGPPPTIVDDNTSEEGCSPQNIPHVKEETPTT
tara:strand:- start:2111 stop:2548 length:438 start_codon:yes stop_codon:yes gene_type:complete